MISSVAFGQTVEKNFIDQNYIEVTGRSEMEVTPDEIYLRIVLSEKDVKGKDLTSLEASMISKLQEIGVDAKKDLSIKDFASNFKNYWILKSEVVLTKEYQLLLHDAKTVGRTFVELQKLGISNITIEKADHSKILEYRKEVKVKAIKATQEKAKSLAMAIGQDIGKAIYINEIDNNAYVPLQGSLAGIQVRGLANAYTTYSGSQEPDIEFEKIKLEYSIMVRFELK